MKRFSPAISLLGFLALSYGAAQVGRAATEPSLRDWYPALRKPAWTPPGGVIGAVWAVLYTCIGISGWLLWRADGPQPSGGSRRSALAAWGLQLAINAAWSVVFFGRRQIGGGMAVLAVLFGATAITAKLAAGLSRPAAALLLPYLAWLGFAGTLNYRIWRLNRGERTEEVRRATG